MKQPIVVLKIGGNIINQPSQLSAALAYFAALPNPAVLVHGGGRKADEILQLMGHAPKMVDGRRITDAPTMEVVAMVYAGLLNKQIVASLQALGCPAIGLSGADGNLIQASKRPAGTIDYGFAGDVEMVNAAFLEQLLTPRQDYGQEQCPIICPITHDGQGQLLNTNADTIAQAIAQALAQNNTVSLRYCFELPGVLEDLHQPESLITRISPGDYEDLKARGIVAAGMIPKLDNAFAALAAGVAEVIIGNLASLQAGSGTKIVA